jgi:hypothetical protein
MGGRGPSVALRSSSMTSHSNPSRVAWIWQAIVAVPVIVALGSVKLGPQVVHVVMLVIVAWLQREAPEARGCRVLRTMVMVATSWAGIAWVVMTVGIAMTRDLEHPTMPVGEVLLGLVVATVAALVVLWLRARPRDRSADTDGIPPTYAEPGLARVLELFALAAAVRVVLDHVW